MKIVLASTSKFKTEILNKVHIKHKTAKSNEPKISVTDPYEYVKTKALYKAKSIKNKDLETIIIGLDTIVLINDKIVEKPKNLEEARTNLKHASNNITRILTGIAILNNKTKEEIIDYQETHVMFNIIDESDIEYYLSNEPDAMYASGFIIETICSNFIKEIKGSYYNVLGVPVEKIYEILKKWDITLKDLED